jgi:hypothetical protein
MAFDHFLQWHITTDYHHPILSRGEHATVGGQFHRMFADGATTGEQARLQDSAWPAYPDKPLDNSSLPRGQTDQLLRALSGLLLPDG